MTGDFNPIIAAYFWLGIFLGWMFTTIYYKNKESRKFCINCGYDITMKNFEAYNLRLEKFYCFKCGKKIEVKK